MNYPNSNVHGANMGPIWGWQDPGGPHVGPMNLVVWVPFTLQPYHCHIRATANKDSWRRAVTWWWMLLGTKLPVIPALGANHTTHRVGHIQPLQGFLLSTNVRAQLSNYMHFYVWMLLLIHALTRAAVEPSCHWNLGNHVYLHPKVLWECNHLSDASLANVCWGKTSHGFFTVEHYINHRI